MGNYLISSRVLTTLIFSLFLGYFEMLPHCHAEIFSLNIEPVVGYERVEQVLPTQHMVNRIVYGGRVTAGILLISLESEYIRGMHEEVYSNMSLKGRGDKLKVGMVSGINLGMFFRFFLRGGVQASQETTELTQNSVTTLTYTPLTYRPYAGVSLKLRLSSQLSASASVVAVISDINDLSRNEYQTTAGFAVRFP